jgi:hypothetical protein
LRLTGEAAPGQPAEITLTLAYRIRKPSALARTSGSADGPARSWLRSAAIIQSAEGRARQFLLRDVTRARGIDPGLFHDNWHGIAGGPVTGGAFLCDFDRDGRLDLLVTDVTGYFLYKGLPGGKFVDVTRAVGLPRERFENTQTAAAFVDLDGDGWEDLILGRHIFRNDAGQRFVDYTYRTNLRLGRDATNFALADYDRDGHVDLYAVRTGQAKEDSWLGGKSGDPRGNKLWRNLGNWRFEDVTAASGAAGGSRSTFAAVWLDANNDNWPDLYVINEFGPGVLLLNRGDGTFGEHPLAPPPNDFGTMGVAAGDIDNDGNIDLYCANMYSKAGSRVISNLRPGTYPESVMAKLRQFVAGSQLWRNQGVRGPGSGVRNDSAASSLTPGPSPLAPSFEPLGGKCQVAAVGWAYGPALVDLDNDGFLDLYATCGYVSQSRDEPDG